MLKLNSHPAGRHFLQIPGPTNVPDGVLRAIDYPTIDHRGPEFAQLGKKVLAEIKLVFQTKNPVVIYSASGTGAWEAALVNTLSPGDRVLMVETGQFATLWKKMADQLGLQAEFIPGDWRSGVDAAQVGARLAEDKGHAVKAVCVVHNETSTGVTSNIAAVRRAIDAADHPALLMVDTISGLASIDYRHDEWGVDVTVAGSQKGLMLPPGLGFNAVSDKALAAQKSAKFPRTYWGWNEIIEANKGGYWPTTPSTNLLYGLSAALDQLLAEGLPNVFARHRRHGEATRAAVRAWGLEILCRNPAEYSDALTAVLMPEAFIGVPPQPGRDADALRQLIHQRFNMSLGTGLGKVKGKVFRIGHLGDFNDLTLMGTLAGVEMGLTEFGVPLKSSGVQAAMQCLSAHAPASEPRKAA
jgi:alanine-glyoxylate transaminase/serine-glyoxylate transaminase/serine-pyruvate transaminase